MNSKIDNPPVGHHCSPMAIVRISTITITMLMLALAMADASAATRRGGSGGGSGGGGNGGRMAQSSVSGANRSMTRPSTGTANRGGASAGTANRSSANTGRSSANTGNVNRGNANTGNANTGNVNRGNVNTGNVNTGNVNRGNVNVGNDVNVNIDGGYGYHGGYYHPVATGVVIGAVAVTTAAVVGSYYSSLPPSCVTVIKSGVSYYQCGSVYYEKTWSGNDVVYVVVNP